MSDLLAARAQMAVSLGFHIVFAAIGVGLPVLLLLAERAFHRTRDPLDERIVRAWGRGLAVFFAVGAVSGTVLSFELGLLWPRFMEYAGPLIGLPFSLEGLAFFTEGIFLGIYLYGRSRVQPRVHWWAAVAVAVSGAASAVFVLSVNGWMNAPTGFERWDGGPVGLDPWRAMGNQYWLANSVHMLLASYAAAGFGAASIHAWRLLRGSERDLHRRALRIAAPLGAVAAILQPLSGDLTARVVAEAQPAKLAAMESVFVTEACTPLHIGGIPDVESGTVRASIVVPCGLSLLIHLDPTRPVVGLDSFPAADRPDPRIVHPAFQVMVFAGVYLALVGLLVLVRLARRRPLAQSRWLLRLLVPAGPLAFLAIEAGWTVTEVGRQPWIVQGYLRVEDAVTPMPGLLVPFLLFTLLYLGLAAIVLVILRRHVHGVEGAR